jgi:hypothetical protein
VLSFVAPRICGNGRPAHAAAENVQVAPSAGFDGINVAVAIAIEACAGRVGRLPITRDAALERAKVVHIHIAIPVGIRERGVAAAEVG